jgi:hypothetical protein
LQAEILLPNGLTNIFVRKQLRRLYERKATITTKVVKPKDEEGAQNSTNILIGQNC